MEETIERCTSTLAIRPDFRYRLAVEKDGKPVAVYYFTRFGEIFDSTGRCGLAQDRTVYDELWREVDAKTRIGRVPAKN